MSSIKNASQILSELGINMESQGCAIGSNFFGSGSIIESHSPVDGKKIGSVTTGTREDFEAIIEESQIAFKIWGFCFI